VSCSARGPCQEDDEAAVSDERARAGQAVQRTIGDGHDLTSPRFAGDPKLEACYDDEARVTKGDMGDPVVKVQQALVESGYDLGPAGADGIYGQRTWDAIKAFKRNEQLGWEHMGDVGPGTMQRLNELFPPDAAPPIPPVTPDGPARAGEPYVCDGVARTGRGSTPTDSDDLTELWQRQGSIFPLTVDPAPPCPSLDFSMFKGATPKDTPYAAGTSSWLVLNGHVIEAKFYENNSWLHEKKEPRGKRLSWVSDEVNRCLKHFQDCRSIFPELANKRDESEYCASLTRPHDSPSCPASAPFCPTRTASNSKECEDVIGRGFDECAFNDRDMRLLRHEQYHMNITCALAKFGNRLIANGMPPNKALARALAKYDPRQEEYDDDSAHGCNPQGQAAWESVIDSGWTDWVEPPPLQRR
jgi:peptidoglycan hydrolase-like protein with peptidoglycan-binding domain